MEVRNAVHPEDVKTYTTERLRKEFLIQGLFIPDQMKLVYSHIDRIITGGVYPVNKAVALEGGKEIAAVHFLDRREIGIINVGAQGKVTVDGTEYVLDKTDGLYIGMGVKEVIFASKDAKNPAKFYFNSTPAHKTYPTVKIEKKNIIPAHLGTPETSNVRDINKYIVPGTVESCQLAMGMTCLNAGSMWNSMPCHTHDRRMEVYFYFDLPEDQVAFHFMGEPNETRHVVMRNEEAVISPSWSIHCGVGTANYTFIWGMAGENQVFDDMDAVAMKDLK